LWPGEQPEADLTDLVQARPIRVELLPALQGQRSERYSTAESLATAQVLLRAREATDEGRWIEL
jgi:hypothetical protein